MIGRSVRRKEDPRLLAGAGLFAADVELPGMLHAAVVRSRLAHAAIRGVDASGALAAGAAATLTAADLGPANARIPFRLAGRPGMERFLQPVLADGVARYAGEPVAVVVASSRYLAEDAAEAVRVDAEPLEPVVDARRAMEADGPLVHPAAGGNLMATVRLSRGSYASARARADVLVSARFAVQRHMASPMETRGLAAAYDRGRGTLRVWGGAKVPHFNRRLLARLLGLPEERVHYVRTDVGGSFGARGEFYPEDFLVPYLALRLGRPVRWVEDRREHLLATNHAREQEHEVEVALARDGRILGMRDRVVCDMGAYARTTGAVTAEATLGHLSGPYDVEALDLEAACVATNKTPAGTYRGPGHYEGSFVRERAVDLCAARLGLDPAEVRRRNLIRPEQMPYRVGAVSEENDTVFQDGDFPELFGQALLAADYDGWRRRQAQAGPDASRRLGVGIGLSVSRSGIGPWEYGRVRVEAGGGVTVLTGGASVGQGVETVLSQICAETLGADYEQVAVVQGDTREVPFGAGSFASRTTVVGGMAVRQAAAALRRRLAELAAACFESAVEDVELAGGRAEVRGVPAKSLSFADLARLAAPGGRLADPSRPALQEEAVWRTGRVIPCPAAAHVAVVELDLATRSVRILRYVIAYDVGRAVNPRLVRGQVLGGLASGVGGALLEELRYDEGGQLLAGSLGDYLLPTAAEVPRAEVLLSERTPSGLNDLGAKGADGGIAASGAAVANAIQDALRHLGAEVARLPLGPSQVDRLLAGRATGEP
jgi:carbon-monoxide dehydrogenase large subunit